MRRIITLMLMSLSMGILSGCKGESKINTEPELSRIKAICELATMDCYFHNVAKVKEEDAGGFLFWKKDKHFWIEYSGVITLGIDASLLEIELKGDKVTITMPDAKILHTKVDSESLTKDSFIVDKDSVDIRAEDEIAAISIAQEDMEKTAATNQLLLDNAKERARELLEQYVENVGTVTGIDYEIEWKDAK